MGPSADPRREALAAAEAELAAAWEAVGAAPEPCYDCPCCATWSLGLTALSAAAKVHLAGELRVAPCHPQCLICSELSAEWTGVPRPAGN